MNEKCEYNDESDIRRRHHCARCVHYDIETRERRLGKKSKRRVPTPTTRSIRSI